MVSQDPIYFGKAIDFNYHINIIYHFNNTSLQLISNQQEDMEKPTFLHALLVGMCAKFFGNVDQNITSKLK